MNDDVNPLSAKLTKWANTLKQFVGNLPMNCVSVFGHFVRLALKGLSLDIFQIQATMSDELITIYGVLGVKKSRKIHSYIIMWVIF